MNLLLRKFNFPGVLVVKKFLEVPFYEGQKIGTIILQLNNLSVTNTHFQN